MPMLNRCTCCVPVRSRRGMGNFARAMSLNVKLLCIRYPILAFLAGTVGCPKGAGRCDSGTNPPWIVNGSYDLLDRSGARRPPLSLRGDADDGLGLSNGPMRASLAAPSLQKWLPDTMVAFAEQTGAGGFGFDYTYFEQNADGTAGPNPSTPASQCEFQCTSSSHPFCSRLP